MKKIGFHILFWIFIGLYDFDYLVDLFNFKYGVAYTLFEVSIYAAEFYVNLFFLLPLILKKKGRFFYFLGVTLLLTTFCSFYFITGLNEDLLSPNFPRAILSFLLNHSLYILMSFFVWYFYKFELEKQKRLQLENEKLQSEMMLLKSQISPHFLFNTLNNIYSLTLLKSDDAPKMLSALSDMLRYFIYDGNKKFVFLESEIDIIKRYIQIQKYRQIPGKDNISISITGSLVGLQIPPLLFMTLIENAFKHGDIVEIESGFVNINFDIIQNKIEFTIINSFQPKEKNDGIGLKNIKSQLEILYKKNYVLDIKENDNQFIVKLNFYGNKQ